MTSNAYKEVDTEAFWSAMCSPRFNRISLHLGKIDGEILHTNLPPETVRDFINDKVNRAIEEIKGKE